MTTQKITIEPVTRIEGHAKVTIHMKDEKLSQRSHILLNWRKYDCTKNNH